MSAVVVGPADRVRAWYAGLAPREQRVVAVGAPLAALLLVVALLVAAHGAVDRAEQRVERKRADAASIQAMLPELRLAPLPQTDGTSLVVVVDRTTRDSGLAMHLRGTEPTGPNAVRVRFEAAPFESAVAWLLRVQREHGLRIQAASFERRAEPGIVDATVTLTRP